MVPVSTTVRLPTVVPGPIWTPGISTAPCSTAAPSDTVAPAPITQNGPTSTPVPTTASSPISVPALRWVPTPASAPWPTATSGPIRSTALREPCCRKDDQLPGLQADYNAMRAAAIVADDAPEFDALIEEIRILEADANHPR